MAVLLTCLASALWAGEARAEKAADDRDSAADSIAGDAERAAAAPAEQMIYLEVGGNGTFYSLNYERELKGDVRARVGAMYLRSRLGSFGDDHPRGSAFAMPVTFSFLGVHIGSHHLELGGGLVPMYDQLIAPSERSFDVSITGIAGYRFAPSDGRYAVRAGFAPHYFLRTSEGVIPWGGLSFGYRF